MFPLVFAAFLVGLLVIDGIFLPRQARRAWAVMAGVFTTGAILAVYPAPLEWLRLRLGVGRAVDIVVYVSTALLVRELFISRARSSRAAEAFTRLVRELALQQPRRP